MGYFDVTRRIDDARISSVAAYQKDLFVHHFRVDELAQLDGEFAAWIAAACEIGAGRRA